MSLADFSQEGVGPSRVYERPQRKSMAIGDQAVPKHNDTEVLSDVQLALTHLLAVSGGQAPLGDCTRVPLSPWPLSHGQCAAFWCVSGSAPRRSLRCGRRAWPWHAT